MATHTTPRKRPHDAGFTVIELLVIVSIIVLLIAILLPSVNRSIDISKAAVCMSNLRQQGLALNGYHAEHFFTYPDHRTDAFGGASRADGYDSYWATTLLAYGTAPKLYQCPKAGDLMTNHGLTWSWAFDQHRIGYGYNGWFLGIRRYSDRSHGGVSTQGYYKLSRTVNPASNLVIADSAPRGSGVWSQSIWWPNSGTNNDEGVNDTRHLLTTEETGRAATLWADGHTELRASDTLNPEGPAKLGDKLNIWDPLRRGKN